VNEKEELVHMFRSTLTLFALIGCIAVVGCSSDDDSSTSSSSSDNSSAASTTASDTSSGQKVPLPKEKLGFVNVLGASPASSRVQGNYVEAAKHLGWDVQTIDGQGDPAKMAQGVQGLVDSKVASISTVSVDPSAAKTALEAAQSADIPTIQIGGPLQNPLAYTASYEENDWAMSDLMTKYMVTNLGYKGEIGMFNSSVLFTFQIRTAARDNVLKNYPDVKVGATHDASLTDPAGDAQATCARMVKANPNIKAIWLLIDAQFGPCIQGLRSEGKQDDVFVVGWYANPDNVVALHNDKAGSAVIHAWLEEGAWATMDQLASHFAKKTPIDPQALSDQPPMEIFTKANVPAGDDAPPPPVPYEESYVKKWDSEYDISN
jgi:ABC-type sugar transport system substrate-binding protein